VKNINKIRITWVTRSFLDYRIPVFKCLDELLGGRLNLIYSGDYVPASVAEKAQSVLGERALGLRGEWKIGKEDRQYMANKNISIRYQPGVIKAVYHTKPDVLVCDGFFKWTLPALIFRIRYGTPLVVCYERWNHTERNAQWYRIIYRKIALRFVDAMCCNGSLSREYTIGLGMPSERITTGHMAADTEGLSSMAGRVSESQKMDLRNKFGIKGLAFLYVGRLAKRKGLTQLLAAWALFEKQTPDGTLLFVGGGEEEFNLKEQCKRLNLRRVRLVGPVTYDQVALFYAAADFFIIPTLEDNWSLVMPEAMACSLPVLCSKYNGCWPELVQEGVNGWVFDPLEINNTLQALFAAFKNRNHLSDMGARSLEIVSNHSPFHAARAIYDAANIAVAHGKRLCLA
jgi:glycosyltransferase involved in cell wall biosynthesis